LPAANAWQQDDAAKSGVVWLLCGMGAGCSRLTPPLPAAVHGLVRV